MERSAQASDRIRPITTGDIGVAMTGRNRFRVDSSSLYSSLLPDNDLQAPTTQTDPTGAELRRRPRALHTQTQHPQEPRRRTDQESKSSSRDGKKSSRHSRKQKPAALDDLWASLTRNNLSRSIRDDPVDDSSTAVHFVNIEHERANSGTPRQQGSQNLSPNCT